MNGHLIPSLGHFRLGQLKPQHIQAVLATKLEDGLSARTVEYIWLNLRRALKVAVQWGLLTRNVADLVTPPRPRHREVKPLSLDEMKQLLLLADGERLGAGFILSMTTGTRRGEVLGLRWHDLDLDADPPRLRVSQSLQRVNGHLVVDEPKSVKGRRSITLSSSAARALRQRRSQQAAERLAAGEAWIDNDLVLTTPLGTPVEPRNFLRAWHELLVAAGINKRPLHEARHAAASLMLSEGVPLKVVQETLGHSTIQLTADLYGHLMPDDADRVAEAMNRALGA